MNLRVEGRAPKGRSTPRVLTIEGAAALPSGTVTKFLHTADWQMGAKLLQLRAKARDGRAVRFRTVETIVNLGKKESVDFFILAGDVFEDPDVDDGVVRTTVDLLNRLAPTPVWVLPGNHDPILTGGVWERRSWGQVGPHVHLLTEAKEVQADQDVALYPCPLKQKKSLRDPTSWIPLRDQGDRRIRIGIAHGGLDTLPVEPNFPIPPGRPESSGLDYLALGDWHGCITNGRAAYPGTPEQTSYSEKDPGNVLLVSIARAGDAPQIRKERVGHLTWAELQPRIQDATDVEAFEREAVAAAPADRLVLRVHPEVAHDVTPEAVEKLQVLRSRWETALWHLDWPEEVLAVSASDAVELPPGLLQDVDAALAALAEDQHPEALQRDPSPTSAETARLARALLHQKASDELR